MYTSLGNNVSSMQTVTCGIPQGSLLGPVLFLIYISDLPNSSEALTFRVFADDTNVFASSCDPKNLETLINAELRKVKDWCDINKLSINLAKTNYVIIKSSRKRNHEFRIHMQSADGTIHTLERKHRIKYFGVMLDETVSFKYHIAYVCSRMSRNLGIISELHVRYYLMLSHLKQIYYSLIYPYISYAILA